MDTPKMPAADLRDYLAEERTFLAWIRACPYRNLKPASSGERIG